MRVRDDESLDAAGSTLRGSIRLTFPLLDAGAMCSASAHTAAQFTGRWYIIGPATPPAYGQFTKFSGYSELQPATSPGVFQLRNAPAQSGGVAHKHKRPLPAS